MSEIKQKRLQILSKLFGDQIKQKIETEKLDISVKELLNKFSDYEITESGKYLEWMTKTYINNGFLYEDLYKVKETLEIFHENKMKLSKEKRDIQQYETLAELWIEIKKFVEQKDDFLSKNEQKRKEKELVYQKTEFLYENDNVRLVAPLTEESSKWWGKGTRWCTAAENNNAFYEYFKDAPLLIFDFKDGEKWQLWMCDDDIQFMDENDRDLTKNKIKEKWNLISNIFMKLLEINGLLIKIIPEEFRINKIYEIAIKQNIDLFYIFLDEFKTEELCKIVVQQNGLVLQYVSENLKTRELCEIAVNNNGLAIEFVPKKFRTIDMLKSAIKNNGEVLYYMSDDLKTKELYEMAVKNYGEILQSVPFNLRTENLCKLAVKNDGNALEFVPIKLITKEICEIAVEQNGEALLFVPDELKTQELCEIAVKQNNEALLFVSDKFRIRNLSETVEKNNIAYNNLIQYKEVFLTLRQENNLNLGN